MCIQTDMSIGTVVLTAGPPLLRRQNADPSLTSKSLLPGLSAANCVCTSHQQEEHHHQHWYHVQGKDSGFRHSDRTKNAQGLSAGQGAYSSSNSTRVLRDRYDAEQVYARTCSAELEQKSRRLLLDLRSGLGYDSVPAPRRSSRSRPGRCLRCSCEPTYT